MKQLLTICISAMLIISNSAMLWADTTAYIPDFGNNMIHRILAPKETDLVGRENVCEQPYGAAVAPGGAYVVLTCQEDADFSVVVITTEHFQATDPDLEPKKFSLGSDNEPYGVAIESRGNKAYVANFTSNTVDEIDIRSCSRTNTYNVGNEPFGVAAIYDEDDNTTIVYVSNHADNSVSVITNGSVDTISDVGTDPRGVALSPDGKKLYVANEESQTVSVIDTSELSIEEKITVGNGPFGVAVASDGDYLFVTNSEDNTVSIIDTETNSVSKVIQVGDDPKGVAAPVNGNFAYVVNHASNNISKITTGGKEERQIGSNKIENAYSLGAFIGGSAPDTPSKLESEKDKDDDDHILLTWKDNSTDELGFKIERREEDVDDDDTKNKDDNNKDDNNENNDTDNDGSNGNDSNKGEDKDDPPEPGVNPKHSSVDDETSEWELLAKVDKDETSYTDTQLNSKETTYHYRIRAYNEAADSDFSNSTEITAKGERFSWCFINTLLNWP